MSRDVLISKVSKGKVQDRITIPKSLKADYVVVQKFCPPNIQEARRKSLGK